MKKILILALVAASPAVFAQSMTIATFADPTLGSGTPMVTFDSFNNTLAAGWGGTGLTLETPGFIGGGSYSDVTFNMAPVGLVPIVPNTVYSLGIGQINFFDNANQALFTIDFRGGLFVDPIGYGSSEMRLDFVQFSGPNVPAGLTDEMYNFSFANRVDNQGIITYTTSFTSSAVPEPASMVALGAGLAALAARRRRK